jgi:hypothetical protein
MVDATSAHDAHLASRMIADMSEMCFSCPMRHMFAAAVPNSEQLFRLVNDHQTSVLTIFATLLPVCHEPNMTAGPRLRELRRCFDANPDHADNFK